ncbi:MAG TPA: Do family serine endopeptidase [Burkholderiales bacterium]|nr:Do family serine endopeptidase [Burkholderiales bacterium]
MPAIKLDRFIFGFVLLLTLVAFDADGQTRGLPDFKSLMKAAGPSVVNVISSRKAQTAAAGGSAASGPNQRAEDPMLEFFRRFMPDLPDRGQPRQGLGSGFIISEDGYILTNAHVVAEFDDVSVRLADSKREFKAKVVGLDKRSDVALLKVDADGLPPARLGDSSKLEPGDWVAAIGSPFGFANTITAGIVSAKGRSLPDEMYVPFIQTDVAVNPGNSGGPLLNLQGEVIGVNSLIYSGTGGYMGVSFAIPIEVALDVSRQLKSQGKVTRGRIGIAIQPVTRELARSFRLEEATGAIIINVEKGGPADQAGVRVGDVVLEWNSETIDEPSELPRLVAATRPGSLAHLAVWREGKRQTLPLRVGEIAPEPTAAAARQAPAKQEDPRLGMAVRELMPAERKTLGVDYGLVVVDVAQRSGPGSIILPGDVIVGVNQSPFASRQEFDKLIGAHHKGDMVALLVRRGEVSLYVPVELG